MVDFFYAVPLAVEREGIGLVGGGTKITLIVLLGVLASRVSESVRQRPCPTT